MGPDAGSRGLPRKTRKRGAAEIFAAAYLLCSRYVNPVTGEACTIHEIIRLLAGQRRQNDANRGYAACLGFSAGPCARQAIFCGARTGTCSSSATRLPP